MPAVKDAQKARTSFSTIHKRASKRKGGDRQLNALLPDISSPKALARLADDRVLAEMTKRIFCSGFVWKIIEQKWPGFEEAFLGFDIPRLLRQSPEFWEALTADRRIVRNGQKIMAVQKNAQFVADIAAEHGSFARFLAGWSRDDQVGLLAVLAKRGSRLGGMTGQYFLRFVGMDTFILSRDVVSCLQGAGLDIADNPTSKKDLALVQKQFSAWAAETGLPYTHMSRICAMSVGENYPDGRKMELDLASA
jgi:3-methyladenine DNA glycosylase Tag